jgi:Tol biopolymer transport system component
VTAGADPLPRGIYRMRLDATELCLLAEGGRRADNPVWSPDGRYIAFVRHHVWEGAEVYVVNADGTGERNVSNHPGDDSAPAWLPGDAHTLTFISSRAGDGSDIYSVDPATDDLHVQPVTLGLLLGHDLEWSPDGSAFASSSTSRTVVRSLDGGDVLQLLSPEQFDDVLSDFWPSWSPDGTRIALEVDRGTSAFRDHDIWVVNTDGTNPVNLTENDVEDNAPAWSPDGQRILFSTMRHGDRDLFTMNPDGSDLTRLTKFTGDEMDGAWSPDGEYVVFTTAREWSD